MAVSFSSARQGGDMTGQNETKVLVRSRTDRMVAGVCGGIAEYFGWDVTLVRVLVAALALVTGGGGLLAYLVAWAIMPQEGKQTSVAEDAVRKTGSTSAR
jgi:phage shock protein C